MFSFRRKPTRPAEEPTIRGRPSLPELNSQGIPWPENLVDLNSIRDSDEPTATSSPKGAAKTSFSGMDPQSPISFHKPFRLAGKSATEGGSISSMYMSSPPSAFESWKHPAPVPASKYSQRRARLPPTFNLMVVGGQGTGKTSLLRLLLETADRAAVSQFLRGSPKATQAIQTATVEICESRFDRVMFSVIDTPGLDFLEGRELKLERQVTGILKYVDAKYSDTMSEESKVIRKSKGDQHIHLCIYMIDPSSIMTAADRRAQSSQPQSPDLVPDTSSVDSDAEDSANVPLTMSPAELRVIKRLSARSNILPVIAHADSLTDDKLTAVKEAVRTGLAEAGLDFGVFSPPRRRKDTAETPRRTHFKIATEPNGNGNEEGEEADEGEERKSRPVIKLRPSRHNNGGRNLSRSRSRRDLSVAADDDRRPISPDMNDRESIANVRFSAHLVAKTDLTAIMPFALIAPTPGRHRHHVSDHEALNTAPSSPAPASEDGDAPSIDSAAVPQTPASVHSGRNTMVFLQGPPEDLKGVFVRKFRWGTVDVLDPAHCDFSALRTTVLSTHLKVLKTHTKEVLYEKYRTEKLLARRATRQITEDERTKLMEGMLDD
ncbi:hypothetical protein BDZ89DRAFT_1091724 [Hymenopellis radicata]|nr:hypothetical protein BDZ89DRAFT_1091724 [Hymenopellis radicata]